LRDGFAVPSNPRDKRPFVRRRFTYCIYIQAWTKNQGVAAVLTETIVLQGPAGIIGRIRNPSPAVRSMFGKKIKTGYESDATRLIRDLLREKPQLAEEQAKGRAQWWDRKLDLDELRRARESRVPQKPYVYQTSD
jgi:hypothetical protein